ncbi:MAG: histidinol-phosphate transaminase [Chitinispirillaceae bacterium]|nr:histidinol-phosphate transaminase [Chitinispirillaceae bacterium]
MNKNETLNLINKCVRDLNGYHLEPRNVPIKLNQNENPFDWPVAIKEEIAKFCIERPWNRYPAFIPAELKELLAKHVGLESSNVIAGNGSNEMLSVLMMSLVHEGSKVIICEPTFTVYRLLSTGKGAECISVNLTNDLEFNIPELIKTLATNPEALVILCTPNNPTGASLDESEIRSILDIHRGFILIDQAYIEFGGYDAIPLLKEYPNLIITRTFSKAFAGAGLRIGYLLGNSDVIAQINKIKLPYNINFLTEHIAGTLLKNYSLQQETIQTLIAERDSMFSFLKQMPFDKVYPSMANFICIRCSAKKELLSYLQENGILVRDVSSYPKLENCFRLSIGTPYENEQFKLIVKNFFGIN